MSKPLSVEEVYFLVRVGSWDQTQLEAWVNECVNYACNEEEDTWEFNDEDEEWFNDNDE